MPSLSPEDHLMLEKLITVCRAIRVSAGREQAASTGRVELFLTGKAKGTGKGFAF